MRLIELTNDWFAFLLLVACGGKNFRMTAAEIKQRLTRMMEEMEETAQSDTNLRQGLEQVRFALVVFADELLISSAWPEAKAWAGDRLEMYYYQTMVGGERFFNDLEALQKQHVEAEVLAIFYLCISLGFRGSFFNRTEPLRGIQMSLYNALPKRLSSRMEDLFPEAYNLETRDFTPRPVAAIGKALFAILFSTLIFLIACTVVNEFVVPG